MKTYTNPGNYTVRLTATNSAGSNTVTRTNLITVTAGAYNEVLTHPTTVVFGAPYTFSISGGKPNTTFTVVIDGGTPSAPLNLDASGAFTVTEPMGHAVGAHVAVLTFAGTGHTRTVNFTVTGGYNEIITHPTSVVVGQNFTWSVAGGMPSTTFTIKNLTTGVTDPAITLDATGAFSFTGPWTNPAGNYSYEFTFAGTGHVRTVSGVATGGTTYNEIITRPSTVVQGTNYTTSITGGMPSTTFSIAIDGVTTPSSPYTLDALGGWTATEAMTLSVGTHGFVFTFHGTGHTQSFSGTVTAPAAYNEIITHPATAVYGQAWNYSVSGGMPNTTATFVFDSDPPSAPIMLDGTGAVTGSVVWAAPAGVHNVTVTFQGTGHVQNFQVTSTGGPAVYNEVWNHPTTVAYGANYTQSFSGGVPNSTLYWIIDGVPTLPPYFQLDASGAGTYTEPMLLAPGTHTFTVHFNGTGHEQTFTGTVTSTVQNTVTVAGTITSSGVIERVTYPTAAVFGQPYTVSVAGGTPNTSFTIYVDGNYDSTVTMDGLGNVSLPLVNTLPIGPHSFQFNFTATGRTINFPATSISAPAPGTYNEILTIPTSADYSSTWSWSVKGGKPNTSFKVLIDGVDSGTYVLDGTGNFTGIQYPAGIPIGYHTFQFQFFRI